MGKRRDKWIINGIRNSDNAVLDKVYTRYLPKITAFIKSRGGSEKDAQDLFQEALTNIFESLKTKDFVIEKSFEAYLTIVVKFLHHKQLRRRETHQRYANSISEEFRFTPPSEIETSKETRIRIILRNYFKISKECMKIIRLANRGLNNETIAKEVGHKGQGTTRVQKHRCLKYLAELIKQDPDMEW